MFWSALVTTRNHDRLVIESRVREVFLARIIGHSSDLPVEASKKECDSNLPPLSQNMSIAAATQERSMAAAISAFTAAEEGVTDL